MDVHSRRRLASVSASCMFRGLAGMMAASARSAAATTSASASASAPSRARAVASRCHTTSTASHHHRRRPRASAPSRHPRPLRPPPRGVTSLAAATTDETDARLPGRLGRLGRLGPSAFSSSPSPTPPAPGHGGGARPFPDPNLPPATSSSSTACPDLPFLLRLAHRASEPMPTPPVATSGAYPSRTPSPPRSPSHPPAVCFDAKGDVPPQMFADYKANRPPTPPEIVAVIPEIEMVRRVGVPGLGERRRGGRRHRTVARRAVTGLHVSIVSRIRISSSFRPARASASTEREDYDAARRRRRRRAAGTGSPAGHRNVTEAGCTPRRISARNSLDPAQFVDMLAMIGDSSDNVPGVEGIGPKTAPRLLRAYGNIEGAVANAAEVKSKRARESLASERGAATAYLCRSLVKIRTELSAPTLNEPTLPMEALATAGDPAARRRRRRREYLERELELPSAERWRGVLRQEPRGIETWGWDGIGRGGARARAEIESPPFQTRVVAGLKFENAKDGEGDSRTIGASAAIAFAATRPRRRWRSRFVREWW